MNLIKLAIDATLNEGYVSEELKNMRMVVCRGCEYYDPTDDKCMKCGCYTDIKAGMDYNRNPKKMMRIEKTHCPMGKWPYTDNGILYPSDEQIARHYGWDI